MTDKMLSRIEGKVGIMTFNNPEKHNAVSFEMWEAAEKILDGFLANPEVRVIVLTGAGGKAFVSGADISKFDKERASSDAVVVYNAAVEQFSQTLASCEKPTIAMIRGYCIGGGVGIAVCCDLRIANVAARCGGPGAKLRVGYGFANLRRLMDLIGPQFVNEMLFTARQFDATEAREMGLVNRVKSDAEIENYVRQLAETIAANAPLT